MSMACHCHSLHVAETLHELGSSAVQCIFEYHILVPGHSGLDRCRLPRQHAGSREVKERPGDALVGEVQDF